MASTTAPAGTAQLARVLTLRDLVVAGIIMVQPTAPMPLYGIVHEAARGHIVTAILIAMVAMAFTAVSYGRMARHYPSAGSAYTYVAREVNPLAGFAVGWSMMMDYGLIPVLCAIWGAKGLRNILPAVPYEVLVVIVVLLMTLPNLRGIQASARTNRWLAGAMMVVIVWMLGAAVRYVLGLGPQDSSFFTRPFYDPQTFSASSLWTGVSLAALTFIGFDAVSTLSEEVVDPRRNVLRATVLVCLLTGALAAVEAYAGQLVWPYGERFPDVDTAYVFVAGKAGGPWLFHAINATLLVASIGSGMGAVLAGARVLYGMGREGAIPARPFAVLEPARSIPQNNVLLLGGVALVGGLLISYQLGAELLNFGAFIGFMGVNLSALLRGYVRADRKRWSEFLPPLLGLLVCAYIWWSLRPVAKVAGGAWLAAGIVWWWLRRLRAAAP